MTDFALNQSEVTFLRGRLVWHQEILGSQLQTSLSKMQRQKIVCTQYLWGYRYFVAEIFVAWKGREGRWLVLAAWLAQMPAAGCVQRASREGVGLWKRHCGVCRYHPKKQNPRQARVSVVGGFSSIGCQQHLLHRAHLLRLDRGLEAGQQIDMPW